MEKGITPRAKTPAHEFEQRLMLAAQWGLRLSDVPLSERLVLDQLLMDGLIERRIRPVESAVVLGPEGKLPAEWLAGEWATETVLVLTPAGRKYLQKMAGWQRQARIAARLAAALPAGPGPRQPAPAASTTESAPAQPVEGDAGAKQRLLAFLSKGEGVGAVDRLVEVLNSDATVEAKLQALHKVMPGRVLRASLRELGWLLGCSPSALRKTSVWREVLSRRERD